jgi:hypothetical protein
LRSTGTPWPPTALEALAARQQAAIERMLNQQQEQIARQQATIDRVVTAHYDRPLERVVHPVAADPMPDWALNDQGDVRPDEIEAGLKALAAESYEVFLRAVGAQ